MNGYTTLKQKCNYAKEGIKIKSYTSFASAMEINQHLVWHLQLEMTKHLAEY